MKIKCKDQSDLICEDNAISKNYDLYLNNFQVDMKKIIGKFRKSYHALSEKELISECNFSLVKNKKKILSTFDGPNFTESNFKKIAYHYVKNSVSWSHYGERNSKDVKNREDFIYNTDDGFKTTFELILDNQGEEDSGFESFDSTNQIHQFFHILKKYSYLLQESQIKILSFMEKGLNQYEISEKMGVTHQAISHSFIEMKELLRSQFSVNKILKPENGKDITKGIKALDSFFTPSRPKLSDKDKKLIKEKLLSSRLGYTANQINSKFLNNKYSNLQIASFCVKNKLFKYLRKKDPRFSKEDRALITKLLEQGESVKSIANQFKCEYRCISGLKGLLVQRGIIQKSSK